MYLDACFGSSMFCVISVLIERKVPELFLVSLTACLLIPDSF